MFLVGPLQDLDIFGLERLSREDVGEVERVDDLADFLFLVVLPLGLFVLELHLRVLGLLLVVHRWPADVLGQVLLELHLWREYCDILQMVRRLGLFVAQDKTRWTWHVCDWTVLNVKEWVSVWRSSSSLQILIFAGVFCGVPGVPAPCFVIW